MGLPHDVEGLLDELPAELQRAFAAAAPARDAFAALVARARAEQGELGLTPARFVAYACARVRTPGELETELRALHAGDLYLCSGCMAGAPGALEAFERLFVRAVEPALVRLGLEAADRQDVAQQLRIKLLVGTGGAPPALARYAGRGSLAGWLRASALRAGLDLLRTKRPADESVWLDWSAAADDPEMAQLKRAYQTAFKRAASDALGAVAPRTRLLLKQHLIDGVSVARLAALHQVHVATVYRWLEDARAALLADTRRRLVVALQIDGPEIERLMGLLQSQLDVSVQRLLGAE
jgi:RNA polymerase sigma-70 factor, ECF subfamily